MAVNYFSDINGWAETEGDREENYEKHFWTWERKVYRRLENLLICE